MRKQIYLLTLILMIFLAFYSLYYYSNYRIRNIPVIENLSEMDATKLVNDPGSAVPGKNKNLIYSPLFNQVIKGIESKESSNLSPDANFIYYFGPFNKNATSSIDSLESKWFKDDFQFKPGLDEGQHFIISHFFEKVVFKNNVRPYSENLDFAGRKVKAFVYYPKEKPAKAGYQVDIFRDSSVKVFRIEDDEENKLIFAYPGEKTSLINAYRAIHQFLDKNPQEVSGNYSKVIFPVLDFHLTKQSDLNIRGKVWHGYQKLSITMNAEFSLLGDKPATDQKKTLTFDQPFLLYYKRKDKEFPYFIGWISHPELLLDNGSKSS